ncbi:hypothetical protein KJ742_05170 [Patescibacteria group bacterium]|nr:hypothetical protein [Patescibacteria group bacterium]MBU1683310.1 hypothetical protein [Patescibacteria group bacterium]
MGDPEGLRTEIVVQDFDMDMVRELEAQGITDVSSVPIDRGRSTKIVANCTRSSLTSALMEVGCTIILEQE